MSLKISLTRLSDYQVDEAVNICLRSFIGEGNASGNAAVGGDVALLPLYWRSMIRATNQEGVVYIAQDDKDTLVGLSMWFAPGKSLFSTKSQRELGLEDLEEKLAPSVKKWQAEVRIPFRETFIANTLGSAGFLNAWFLSLLVVAPELQGNGIGRRLVQVMVEELHKTTPPQSRINMVLTATTDHNEKFYHSMDFTTVGKAKVPSSIEGEEYQVICMKRELNF